MTARAAWGAAGVAVSAVALAAGCFSPSLEGVACGAADECPSGLTCVDGTCRSNGGTVTDAAINGTIDASILPTGDAGPTPDASGPATDANPVRTITESVDPITIAGANSVACTAKEFPVDNWYYRAFPLPDFDITGEFRVTNVQLGVESAQSTGAGVSGELIINELAPETALAAANLTEVASYEVVFPDASLALQDIPTDATISAGATLVVELYVPTSVVTMSVFYIGSNSLGETAPSYLRAPECGVMDITAVADIDQPQMQIVMSVTGTVAP